MGPVGRAAELGEIDALLESAAAGSGGVLTLAGPPGSGKTALLAAATEMARDRGFEVLGAAPVRGQPGRLVWAQLLHDAGAGQDATTGLLHRGDPLAASTALRVLTAGRRRLIVIDDLDIGGHDAVEMLALVASRVVVSSTAVVATAGTPLGVGRDLKLAGLAETELGEVIGDVPAEQRRAVWVASGGMPGTARMLAGQLDGLPPGRDALVQLALHAAQRGEFLAVDDGLGLQHLRALLAAPRRDIAALDLAAGGPGLQASAGAPVLDPAAAASYKGRLAELAVELDAADAAGDTARAARAEAEREWLHAELRQATGLGGRMRRTTAESERARVNVTRTLRSALDRISAAAPRAGAHLQASIRTGPPTTWAGRPVSIWPR